MNNRNIQSKKAIPVVLMALALACLPWPMAQADPPIPRSPFAIVGLWQVEYTGSCQPPVLPPDFFTYQQFHSDGLEFESADLFPGAHCIGTWKQVARNMVQLFHVGWTPGGVPGAPTSVRFAFTETLTVSPDGNSYSGTLNQAFYDAPVGGNAVAHCTATTQATRISVQ